MGERKNPESEMMGVSLVDTLYLESVGKGREDLTKG